MKLHTETHTPTDIEIAKQLEELWHTIERGITTANQATKQAADIHTAIIQDNSKIAQLKHDTLSYSQTIRDNIEEIQEQQTKLEANISTVYQIRDEVASYLQQIGDYQTLLDTFRQGLKVVIESVDTTKNQAQQLETILPAFTKDLPQQLEQIETTKQEIARYQEKIQQQTSEVSQKHTQIQTLKSDVEIIISNFGGKQTLDKLNQDNQNIHNQLQQAQTEIERLNQKLEAQAKKQKQFNNWLLALSLVSALTLILSIMR